MRLTVLSGFVVILILISTNTYGVVNLITSTRARDTNLAPLSGTTIVINEFMPDPASDWDGDLIYDSTGDEWVELYNYGASSVDISSWRINDSTAERYTFPIGVIIPPGGFYVAYGSNQSLSLNNGGDRIELLNGTYSEIDSRIYSSSNDDISIGRLPNGGTAWTEFNDPTPGQTNGIMPKIVINEVMYDPAGSDTENEWLELFNNDSRAINITNWELTDQDGEIDYIFKIGSIPYIILPPQKYLLLHSSVGTDELDFSDGVGNLYMSRISSMLNNDGDDILLMDRGGLYMDYIAYGKSTTIDPPPSILAWDGVWYNASSDTYSSGYTNPVADYDDTIRRVKNGRDRNSVYDWGNASGVEITKGRNNSEIVGLEVVYSSSRRSVEVNESTDFNLIIVNTGKVLLNLIINSTAPSAGWDIELSHNTMDINPNKNITLTITVFAPSNLSFGNKLSTNITIKATNVNLSREITLTTVIPAVELEVTYIEIDDSTTKYEITEGEIVELKAQIINTGELTGEEFSVNFYFDKIDTEHLLGSKNYGYISQYRYPSISWDTLGFRGNYTIIVFADANNNFTEPDENNNRFEYLITIVPTNPSLMEQQVLIIEVYYDPRESYDTSEFLKIYNPTEYKLDLSGWQITDDPKNDIEDTIRFPMNTWLNPGECIYITNEAEAFKREIGHEPDLAVDTGNLKNVNLLDNADEWSALSNSGDLVILRDQYRHIIDMMSYGASNPKWCPGAWHGNPVPTVPEGKILKRQRKQNEYMDTNSTQDWSSSRLYGIGQTDLYPQKFTFTGEVIPFSSPENSYEIITSQIDSAETEIYLNLYQFTHPWLAQSLSRALKRGVEVWILLEGNPVGWNFSNIDDPTVDKYEEYAEKYIVTELYKNGARIKFLSDIQNDHKNKNIFKRYTYNHGKYAVIDSNISIIMSGNWKPTGVPTDNSFGNRDWGIVIKNPEVSGLLKTVFESDWSPVSDHQNDTHYFDINSMVYGPPPKFYKINYTNSTNWYEPITDLLRKDSIISFNSEFTVELVFSPDTSARSDAAIIGMIKNADKSVFIQQMDCNLDWRLSSTSSNKLSFNWSDPEHYYLEWSDGKKYYNEYLTAAIDAARRGLYVKILLDSRYVEQDVGIGELTKDSEVDNFDTVKYINKVADLEGLTENLEARLCFLNGLEKMHNKGMIVDGHKTFISSINWNYNSVANNREVGVIIDYSNLAYYYIISFNHDWWSSEAINIPELPNASESELLITEFYADTYFIFDGDEYVAITNPSDNIVDISGWILTDKLTDYGGNEGNLVFPVGTYILPQQTIYVARIGLYFYQAHNFLPDFEYFEDSLPEVPNIDIIDPSTGMYRGPRFSNKGDEIVLADRFIFTDQGNEHEHIIDMVVYGNSTFISDFNNISYPFNSPHWLGPSIYNVTEGEILKRNKINKPWTDSKLKPEFMDTNTAIDWENNWIYHPGQSDFKFKAIEYSGTVTVFSSPDSSYQTIANELNNAQISIYLSIYQFHNLHLLDRLINASERGVDVKVFLDGTPVGGLTDTAKFVAQQLVEQGCEVRFIRSVTNEDIQRRYSFLHNKYAVIDNFTTVVMSENWKNSGVPVDNTAGNRGWGIILRNTELATSFARVFFHDWNPEMRDSYAFNSSDNKYGDPPEDYLANWAVFGGNYKPRFNSKTINGEFKVTPIIAPDNTLDTYGSILEMINSATESVYIEQLDCYLNWNTKKRDVANQYLLAVIEAARRGCVVKILLDSAFVDFAGQSLDNYDIVEYVNSIALAENLTNKLQAKLIYLYGSGGRNELEKVHNKGVIVDGKKTLISSINWVTGSVIYNREAGVIIENEKVAQFYTELFNYDWNLTVNEYIEAYILYSKVRDLTPGEETEYVVSLINIQPNSLFINLSISGLAPGWAAELDTNTLELLPANKNYSYPSEVRITVSAPTQKYLDGLKNFSDYPSRLKEVSTLDLYLRLETSGMAADVIFTTTNLVNASQLIEDDETDDEDNVLDRTLIDPWLVVILIAVMLIIGAVARDLVHHALKKKREKIKGKESDSGVKKEQSDFDHEEDIEE